MSAIKYYAIIVAGGLGSRMHSAIPKQFMLLNGRPVLMHTIDAFFSSEFSPEIITVLHDDYHDTWQRLCVDYNFTVPHKLVSGGNERFYSVKEGLQNVESDSIVAIHDAVRPCVSHRIIDSAFRQARDFGNAVSAIRCRDSIRQDDGLGTVSLNRDHIHLVQTPQVFRSADIIKAYEQDYRPEFTDDASVAESSGVEIKLIEGDRRNLKITYLEDIKLAEAYLNVEKPHPLNP